MDLSLFHLVSFIAAISITECQDEVSPRVPCLVPNQHCDCTVPKEVVCLNVNFFPNSLPTTTVFLDLGNNFIGPVVRRDQVDRLKNLPMEKLFISNNNVEIIQDAAFELLYRLIELDISENNIQALTDNTFKGLKSLTYLYANDAGIETLSTQTFEPVSTLEYIDLEDNRISTIGLEFSILPNLKTLLLAENQITQISRGAFSGLDALMHLSLFGNRLNKPMFSWFRDIVKNNGKIELDRRANSTNVDPNPWLCCSDIAQYHNYVIERLSTSLVSYSELDLVCFWPVALSGRLISTLTRTDLEEVSCADYTTSTTSTPFLTSSSPNVISKAVIHENFLSSLTDAGAFFILLLVAVLSGLIIGGLCYCYRTKKGKQRFHAVINVFRRNSPDSPSSTAEDKTTTELTTRPYRQETPAYGATASAERGKAQGGSRQPPIRPTRRAPPAPPGAPSNSLKPIEVTNPSFTIETDHSEDEVWSRTERKDPV